MERYIGLDVHGANCTFGVIGPSGRKLRQDVVETHGVRRSLTWDRGTELALHKGFTIATDVAVYFCDPQSPWQRGTNENTNRMLRQDFPRGTDLSGYSQADRNTIAKRLNTRPRKTLGFRTPADKLRVAVTG